MADLFPGLFLSLVWGIHGEEVGKIATDNAMRASRLSPCLLGEVVLLLKAVSALATEDSRRSVVRPTTGRRPQKAAAGPTEQQVACLVIISDAWMGCFWSRSKPLCCRVRKPKLPDLECSVSGCALDAQICSGEMDHNGNYKRDSDENAVDMDMDMGCALDKRGAAQGYNAWVYGVEVVTRELRYDSQAHWMEAFRNSAAGLFEDREQAPQEVDLEHIIPAVVPLGRFVATSMNWPCSDLSRWADNAWCRRERTTVPRTNTEFWRNVWNSATLPSDAESLGYQMPFEFIADELASTQNRSIIVLLQRSVNGLKGRLEVSNSPMANSTFQALVRQTINDANEAAVEAFFGPMPEVGPPLH
ncbi:hypothetical protein N657DRAFT_670402 [Parathielavia appendiculata]|uniref:Uncharacterized protein n=1 Tax=Parathielavia appendiculata TaxID=2587402 RepID=A0AAN6Z5E4_9PEZI|nr:hypothetical protein N657DRAFT_670402 [Parathielavia appendiculata]